MFDVTIISLAIVISFILIKYVFFKSKTKNISDFNNNDANILLRKNTDKYIKTKVSNEEYQKISAEYSNLISLLNYCETPKWIRDKDLNIIYCNDAYKKAIKSISVNIDDLPIPELHNEIKDIAKQTRLEQNIIKKRMHIILNGERKYYDILECYIKDADINVAYALDCGEIEKLEKQIKQHSDAQSNMLEISSSASAIFDNEKYLQYYNESFVRMWELDDVWLNRNPSFGEFLECLRTKRKLPEQANFKSFKQNLIAMFTSLLEPHEEFLYLPDGKTLRFIAIPHALGGLLISFEDVTDRLALERSYNTLIAVRTATLDNLHEGVAVFGEDGRLRLSNPIFMDIWRLENISEGMHIRDILEEIKPLLIFTDWEIYINNFIAHLQNRKLYASRIERTDGVVLEWSAVPLPDGATLLTYIDITASTLVERSLREKNEALESADKLKSEFLANVSYELRSPLTSISGFTEMLRGNYFGELSEKQLEYTDGIYDSAQYLNRLIGDILDLASIEAGYLELEIDEFEIYPIILATASLLQKKIATANIKVNIKVDKNIGIIRADKKRIKQILTHLFANAVKFSHINSIVEIGAKLEKNNIKFWVHDDGVGVTQQEQELIFEKFYRGKKKSEHNGGRRGTGLGLPLSKILIEMHGGKISLISKEDSGTKVEFTIPLNINIE